MPHGAPCLLNSHDGLGGGPHDAPHGTVEVMGSERTTTMFKAKQWAFPCNAEALHEEHGPDFDTSKAFDKCSRKPCCYMFFGSSLSPASLRVSNLPLPFSCKDTCHQSQGPLRFSRGNSSLDFVSAKRSFSQLRSHRFPELDHSWGPLFNYISLLHLSAS